MLADPVVAIDASPEADISYPTTVPSESEPPEIVNVI